MALEHMPSCGTLSGCGLSCRDDSTRPQLRSISLVRVPRASVVPQALDSSKYLLARARLHSPETSVVVEHADDECVRSWRATVEQHFHRNASSPEFLRADQVRLINSEVVQMKG